LSQSVAVDTLLREAASPILKRLSDQLSLTVNVGLLEDNMVTYLAKIGDHANGGRALCVGDRFEAYCSGMGKVLLAALPDNALEAFLLDGDFVALTEKTITSRSALRVEFQRVRKQGYAIDDLEFDIDRRCIAVPVRDNQGRTFGAISVSDRPDRMTEGQQERLLEALLAASSAITQVMFPFAPTGRKVAR
jgi:IclR family acetate operon transcriptional repressor